MINLDPRALGAAALATSTEAATARNLPVSREPHSRTDRRVIWALAGAAVLALLLKIALALFTVGSNDALTWDHDLIKLRTDGFAALYREGVQYPSPAGKLYARQDFIHPPAVVHGLRGLGLLQDASGLPLRFWLRLACALADMGTLMVVWMMFGGPGDRGRLILLALCPVSILVSGFHANTDPIMISFVVLCVLLLDRQRVSWAAVAFGLAASVKLVPMIFAPAILLYLPDLRTRTKWVGIAALTWITMSMPYLGQEPVLVLKRMFGYGSSTGLWGFYMLSCQLKDTAWEPLHRIYAPSARWLALLAVALLPAGFRLLRLRLPLFVQCGMTVFLFLFLSPGFGVQYLAWTVPWIVALGFVPMAGYYAMTTACLLAIYSLASGRVGINAYADVLNVDFTMRIFLRFVCWITIGAIVWLYARVAVTSGISESRQSKNRGST